MAKIKLKDGISNSILAKEKYLQLSYTIFRQLRVYHWSYNKISLSNLYFKSSIYKIVTCAHFKVPLYKTEAFANFKTLRRYHLASLENIIFNYHSMRYFNGTFQRCD